MSRMREEWDATHDNERAVARASRRRGESSRSAGLDHVRGVHGLRRRLDRRPPAVRVRPRRGDPRRRDDRPSLTRAERDEAFGRYNWWLPEQVARVARVEPSPLQPARAARAAPRRALDTGASRTRSLDVALAAVPDTFASRVRSRSLLALAAACRPLSRPRSAAPGVDRDPGRRAGSTQGPAHVEPSGSTVCERLGVDDRPLQRSSGNDASTPRSGRSGRVGERPRLPLGGADVGRLLRGCTARGIEPLRDPLRNARLGQRRPRKATNPPRGRAQTSRTRGEAVPVRPDVDDLERAELARVLAGIGRPRRRDRSPDRVLNPATSLQAMRARRKRRRRRPVNTRRRGRRWRSSRGSNRAAGEATTRTHITRMRRAAGGASPAHGACATSARSRGRRTGPLLARCARASAEADVADGVRLPDESARPLARRLAVARAVHRRGCAARVAARA